MRRQVEVLDNVERVRAAEDPSAVRGAIERHEPVIIVDSQRGTRLGGIRTEAEALAAFGDLPVQVQRNYTSPLTKARAAVEREGISQKLRNDITTMPLRAYCEHVRRDPGTDLLCVEYGTPPEVRDAMVVPPYCRPAAADGGADPLVSFLFVANQDNYAHLHFDGDYRHVLLYQVFGTKRVTMIPVTAGDKVQPAMNFSKVLLQNMDAEEKRHYLRYAGAWDCLLEPGESIYFPPSIWHYVEYVETGMSVNIRFGRHEIGRRFVDANRNPFYPELHELLHRMDTDHPADERARLAEKLWPEIEAVLVADYATTDARHRAVQSLYRDLLATVSTDDRGPRILAGQCPITDAMAVERYDAASRRWRDELMLGAPL